MGHDVFISHSTLDKLAADAVCHGLEAKGIRCWMAPRDQIAGKAYGEQITEAIRGARVMVLVFSDNVNKSQAVLNEINLAAGANVTIVPFRIAKVEFNSELNYYLGRTHWLDAFPPPLDPHVDALAATIRRNLPDSASGAAAVPPLAAQSTALSSPTPPPQPHPPPHRNNYMPLAIVGVVFTFVLIIVLIGMLGGRKPSPAQEQATNTIAQAVANAIQAGAKNDDQPPAQPVPGVNAPSSEAQQPTDQDGDQAPGNAVGASNAPPAPHRGFFDKLLHRSAERHGADR
jgi:hypothetical protein